jgi:hypothetical protein
MSCRPETLKAIDLQEERSSSERDRLKALASALILGYL